MRYEAWLRPVALCLFLMVGVLTGCRTYGGYGSEEAAREEIVQAVDNYESLLAQARTVLTGLREAGVEPYTEQFDAVVTGHTVLLTQHRAYAAAVADSDDYRTLHRTLGAMVAEQRQTQRQYAEIMERVQRLADTTSLVVRNDSTARLAWSRLNANAGYYVAPPYYEQVQRAPAGALPRLEIGARADTTRQ